MTEKYWPAPMEICRYDSQLELRATLAWELISAQKAAEDSAGRVTLELQSPAEIVARAYAIVDAFLDCALERGELRQQTEEDIKASFVKAGEMEKAKYDAIYPNSKKTWNEIKEEVTSKD